MKILMIGGTAFFGKDIVRFLEGAGHSVTIFTRSKNLPEDLSRFPHTQGDRTSLADLKRVAESDAWDVVIDNIAYDAQTVRTALSIFKDVKQYVFTSTISVYRFVPKTTTQPMPEDAVDYDLKLKEEDRNDPHWKYARGKMEAECALVRQDKVPWTIVRPSIVYGPHDNKDRVFWYLARLPDGQPIIIPNGGLNTMRLAYSLDVAYTYLPVVERSIALGRIYNVAQAEVVTLRDLILDSAAVLGHKANLVSVPFAAAGEMGGPLAYDRNWIPDIEAAKRDLGFMPTPWDKIVARSAAWFRDCWNGDVKTLLVGREKEIKLARQWAVDDTIASAG